MMTWLFPSIIATLSGTFLLVLIYLYFYLIDRETAMGIWCLSWLIYMIRYIFMIIAITNPGIPIFLILNQMTALISGTLLLWGTYVYLQKKLPLFWVYGTVVGCIWIIVSILSNLSFLLMALPTFFFLSLVFIYTGVVFLKSGKRYGFERFIVGGLFIVWGIHKADYPFLRPVEWFAPWGYMFSAILEFALAMGIVLVYFQTTRRNLIDNETRFGQLVENIEEAFWIASPDWRTIHYISPGYEKIWGLRCESLYRDSFSWFDPVIESDKDILKPWLVNLKKEGLKTITTFPEYRIQHPNGDIRWIFARSFPIWDKHGNVMRIAGIASDISEKKKLEIRLQQSHKMEAVGTLAGGIAHDFNNLLSIIIGYTELGIDETPADNPTRTFLKEILTASFRARDVVRQLLSFSRQNEPKRQPISLSGLINEIEGLIRGSLPSTITIKLDIPPSLPPIMADSTQIHQVILNLCSNAAQSMEIQGGTLSVRVRETTITDSDHEPDDNVANGAYIELNVSDTGSGIPAHIQNRIFDPYFTTKAVGKGTGMGLAMVHGIVKSHSGHIRFTSTPGQGTTFTILFPVIEGATAKY